MDEVVIGFMSLTRHGEGTDANGVLSGTQSRPPLCLIMIGYSLLSDVPACSVPLANRLKRSME